MKKALSLLFLLCVFALKSQVNHDSLVKVASALPDNLYKLILYNAIEGSAKTKEEILPLSEKTIDLADKLLKLYPGKSDSILHFKGIAYNDIGYYYKEFGKSSKAVEYILESIKIHDRIRDSAELITGYNNLAIIIREQGDTITALNYLFKAEKLAISFNRPAMLAHVQSMIGQSFKQRGQFDKAMEYYNKSLAIARETNNLGQIGKLLNFTGNVHLKLGRVDQALQNFEESYRIFENKKDYSGMSSSLLYTAGIWFNFKKDLAKAEKYYVTSLDYALKTNNLQNIQYNLEALGKLYNQTGRHKLAYDYYFRFIKFRDSLHNEETKKSVLKKELQYSFDKKASADSIKNAEEKKAQQAIIKANQNELKQEKNFRYTLYAGISLLLMFGLFSYNRYKLTQKQKNIIEVKNRETESQKIIIEEKQKEILDSIHYAKRIQQALLASKDLLDRNLSATDGYFVYFNPKDIVSGDFYWATEQENYFYLAVCDSTGHGVPGAFMSLLNIGFMSEAIKEHNILSPELVFNYVRKRLVESISGDGQKDGFDGILLRIDKVSGDKCYAAAHNRPVIFSNGELNELHCDKMPVGYGDRENSFNLYNIDSNIKGWLYLYTDGYADQFGGEKGKKFKYKSLHTLLCDNASLNSSAQKENISSAFDNWKGRLEQVDDVLLIGLKL